MTHMVPSKRRRRCNLPSGLQAKQVDRPQARALFDGTGPGEGRPIFKVLPKRARRSSENPLTNRRNGPAKSDRPSLRTEVCKMKLDTFPTVPPRTLAAGAWSNAVAKLFAKLMGNQTSLSDGLGQY
uniref:Uncharacterized protein n=1 Tax=Trichuris muris TaxID=70415 RepID=A0A5S6Q785_TRIMR